VLTDFDLAHVADGQRAQQGVGFVLRVLDERVHGQQSHVFILLGLVDDVKLGQLLALQV